jgi:antagonist of KipI
MSLRVVEAGLYSLLVDYGRPSSRSLGVPVGGAADRFTLALGNALVGNPPQATALEICLAGPTLQAEYELACVVFGAPFELRSDRQALQAGKTFTLEPGEAVHVGGTARGARAYFCVRGGIEAPLVLGSHSALEPLQTGAKLPCSPGHGAGRFLHHDWKWNEEPHILRAVDGPQTAWFDPEAFFNQARRVTPASNRMGLRLQGPPLSVPNRELVSEAVCPGTVQVTRDGQCIVLGVDGQTIGGYPKVAQVITADVDKLGQLRPGDEISFRRVTLEEAESIYRAKQAELHEWLVRLAVTSNNHVTPSFP